MKKAIILVLALVALVVIVSACDLFNGAERVEWEDGILTVSSDELKPAATVPEGDFYNTSWFAEPPLVQSFAFTVNGDWWFTITASGEVGTRFEVYASIELTRSAADSYSYDQVFTLDAETESFTKERPLAEGHEPPVDVEIKVLFDEAMDWEMVIEEVESEYD